MKKGKLPYSGGNRLDELIIYASIELAKTFFKSRKNKNKCYCSCNTKSSKRKY